MILEKIPMKTSRFTDAQIMAILKQAEDGIPVAELCREHGMSDASFYKWRAKFGGTHGLQVAFRFLLWPLISGSVWS
jgi:putative transposase